MICDVSFAQYLYIARGQVLTIAASSRILDFMFF